MRTPRTHFMFDKAKMLYFKETSPGKHEPVCMTKADADLYSPFDQQDIGLDYYGDSYHFTMMLTEEATVPEYHRWRSKRGGKAKSPAKTAAVRANGSLPKLRWTSRV